MQPTLGVVEGERKALTWDLSDIGRIDRVLPRKLKDHLASAEGGWSLDDITALYRRHMPDSATTRRALNETSARLGVELATIFEAATLGNARAFHLENEIGSARPGLQADLLLLGASPLDSVAAHDDIDMVFVDGVPVDRSGLSAY